LTEANLDGSEIIGNNLFTVYRISDKYFIYFKNKKYYFSKTGAVINDNSNTVVFEFYINPERITPSYRKLITETRTRGGWDVQHWGEQLIEIRVEGRTGGLIKGGALNLVKEFTNSSDIDITQSYAWKRLNELKKLYDGDHKQIDIEGFVTKLGFNYYDRFYIGYFSEFSGPLADAEKPYIMNYSFTFKVESSGEYLMDSSLDSLKVAIPQTLTGVP